MSNPYAMIAARARNTIRVDRPKPVSLRSIDARNARVEAATKEADRFHNLMAARGDYAGPQWNGKL